MKLIRSFVAIEMPGEVKEQLAPVLREIGELDGKLKPVDPANMHLTIKFLGDVTEGGIVEACRICGEASGRLQPISAEVAGVGVFPGERRPRVIWAGCRETSGRVLVDLYNALDSAMESIGVASERRGFKPHLTLARVRQPGDPARLMDFLTRWDGREFGEAFAGEICLFMSELGRSGPTYTKMGTFPLVGGP